VVSSTLRPHFNPGKDPVPILQKDGWAPGPVWTGGKSRPHRDSIPDRPARSSVALPTELPGPLKTAKTFGKMYLPIHIAVQIPVQYKQHLASHVTGARTGLVQMSSNDVRYRLI